MSRRASAVAGIPEAITAEVHGLLVPPADVAALSAALRRLLSDEELRRRLGAAARARALGEFSLDAMTSAYERHYVAGN